MKYTIATLLIFLFHGALGQTNLSRLVDSLIGTQFKPNEPGISILIANKSGVVYKKALGSANLELNVPMQPDMVFRIGSITKQFTAIGILQLAGQGKLSLQDSIQRFIPDFPYKGHTIRIEHLLTHTSGIPDYSNADTTHTPYIERHEFTPKQLIKSFDYMPLEFKPGTKYNYTNSGYVLLAYIIQQVSGKNYHRYMMEQVIGPAGLRNTVYANENTIVPNRVSGYTKDQGYFENREFQTASLAYGAGDLYSTTEDLYQWNKALYAQKIVSKELLQKAFTPYTLSDGTRTSYGYGWFIDSFGIKRIHHEGQVSGFTALESYYPDLDVYVAILTNQLSGEDKTDFTEQRLRLFDKIMMLATGREPEKEVSLKPSDLDKFTGTYAATFGKKQTLTITKRDGKLYMNLSNGTGQNMLLQPLSNTQFLLPDIKNVRTTCDFNLENGKVSKLTLSQGTKYVWEKIN